MSAYRALSIAALGALVVGAGASRLAAAPAAATPSPVPTAAPLERLTEEVRGLRARLDALAEAGSDGRAPAWAEQMGERLERRIERLQRIEERIAARVESPTPRLDEPVVLLSVAAAMLVIGYAAGRRARRRGAHRERLRL